MNANEWLMWLSLYHLITYLTTKRTYVPHFFSDQSVNWQKML